MSSIPLSPSAATLAPAVRALRRSVLHAMRGPAGAALDEVPRRWPVLRAHVAGALRMLRAEGLVEPVEDGCGARPAPRFRATAAGLREGEGEAPSGAATPGAGAAPGPRRVRDRVPA